MAANSTETGGSMNRALIAFASLVAMFGAGAADLPRNGATYRNPVIFADCPDPTMCRAGDYVYLVTTTMFFMPGGPVMRSKDMVHWETVSYIFDRIDTNPEYSFEADGGRTGYGAGQWATSLVHHKGKFYAWFIVNGAGMRTIAFFDRYGFDCSFMFRLSLFNEPSTWSEIRYRLNLVFAFSFTLGRNVPGCDHRKDPLSILKRVLR